MLVVVLDPMGSDESIERDVLAARGHELERLASDPQERRRQLSEAVALLATDAAIDAELLDNTPNCRVAATYGVGYDNIDTEAARSRGVVVTNVPDYCTTEVADHTVALILALLRGVVRGDAMVRAGRWDLASFAMLRRLEGLRLGLVGLGRIGRAVAARAASFGFAIRASDPWLAADASSDVPPVPLAELLSAADVVSLHVPLTPATRGLIGRREIALMQPGAVLVNTSRGGLLDLGAALAALDEGRLGGLALDVFPEEPVDPSLFPAHRNVVVTPHIAFYSVEAMEQGRRSAASTIADVLDGREVSNRVA